MKSKLLTLLAITTLFIFSACEKQQIPELDAGGKITKWEIFIDECKTANATKGTLGLYLGDYEQGLEYNDATLFHIPNPNSGYVLDDIDINIQYYDSYEEEGYSCMLAVTDVDESFTDCIDFQVPHCVLGSKNIEFNILLHYSTLLNVKGGGSVTENYSFTIQSNKSLEEDDVISENVYSCYKKYLGFAFPLDICAYPGAIKKANTTEGNTKTGAYPGIHGNEVGGGGTTTGFLQIIPEPNKGLLIQEAAL